MCRASYASIVSMNPKLAARLWELDHWLMLCPDVTSWHCVAGNKEEVRGLTLGEANARADEPDTEGKEEQSRVGSCEEGSYEARL